MKFIENLYFGQKAEDEGRSIIRKLSKGKYLPGVCIITLPSNPDNLLDIVEAFTLNLSSVKRDELTVVGIALGMEEAHEVVRQIVDDAYHYQGSLDIIKYLGLV